jgi:hypothetical protein
MSEKKPTATAKTMTLSLKDRLMIPNILPQESDITSMVLKRDIGRKIELTQGDLQASGLQSGEGRITWSKNIDVEVSWSDSELKMLKDAAAKLDADKKITDDNLDLVLKIREA